ncbi:hypothetical protein SEA_ZOOMAN_203 [Microbacterium phage Zooman]|nr:hypothetical protein SEA_ZOOMAN_203 [Microbacterium phage Zooman]
MATPARGTAADSSDEIVTKSYVDAGAAFLQDEIDDLSDVVATKATESNVNNQLAQKANASDLDNVFGIATSAVPKTTTVAGKPLSGNITLAKGDVGLGNADNTSDANKPVSTAQQTALNAKVNTADVAALNVVGWGRAVFIPKNGTVPANTPTYTIVIESDV